jgi:hypothetical protein
MALGNKGQFDEAFAEWLRYLSLDGDAELAQELGTAARKISGPGDPGQKLAHITLSYYQKKSKTQYVAPLAVAGAYMDLSDKDRAFEWLNKAYQEHSTGCSQSLSYLVSTRCAPTRASRSCSDALAFHSSKAGRN